MSTPRRRDRWPGVARTMCLLEQARDRRLEPLGLVGWEIRLPRGVARQMAAWIPHGDGGRVLCQPGRRSFFAGSARRPLRPRPTVPLLVRATHRSLRLLYQCTPAEGRALGERLTATAADALLATEVAECPPAILSDLLSHYLRGDPQALTLLAADDGQVRDRQLLGFVEPWSRTEIFYSTEYRDQLPFPPSKPGAPRARLRTYGGRPTTLVPLGLLLDPPGLPLSRIADALSMEELWQPLCEGGPYKLLPSRVTPLLVSLLMPLRGDDWQQQLQGFRDTFSRRLGTLAGWFSVLQEDFVDLAGQLSGLQGRMLGAERVHPEPYRDDMSAGPRHAGDDALRLLREIMAAIDTPFDVRPLLLESGQELFPGPMQ